MTLFFGQLFVTVVNNGNRISILGFTRGYNITGGPNGIAEHRRRSTSSGASLESLTSYYYVALVFFLVCSWRSTSSTSRGRAARGGRCARTRSRPR